MKNKLTDFPKTTIEYNKKKYIWHKRVWTYNNLTISTSLQQELTNYCIKNNLISLDQFLEPKFEVPNKKES